MFNCQTKELTNRVTEIKTSVFRLLSSNFYWLNWRSVTENPVYNSKIQCLNCQIKELTNRVTEIKTSVFRLLSSNFYWLNWRSVTENPVYNSKIRSLTCRTDELTNRVTEIKTSVFRLLSSNFFFLKTDFGKTSSGFWIFRFWWGGGWPSPWGNKKYRRQRMRAAL